MNMAKTDMHTKESIWYKNIKFALNQKFKYSISGCQKKKYIIGFVLNMKGKHENVQCSQYLVKEYGVKNNIRIWNQNFKLCIYMV